MSKRELKRRERRAFEKGVFCAIGGLMAGFAVFSYFTDDVTLASALAMMVMALCCFNGEDILRDGRLQDL